jgi:hypothetical protein
MQAMPEKHDIRSRQAPATAERNVHYSQFIRSPVVHFVTGIAKEMIMPQLPVTERARAKPRAERREPDFVVRAKVGPSRRSWATVGYCWRRENGEGFSIQLSTLPISNGWGGVLKLLPPYLEDEA